MNNRLKELRENLGLTTRSLGEKLSLSAGTITNMEKGVRNITERTIKDICNKFNVNEIWFKEGKGEMYNNSEMATLERLTRENNLDETDKEIISGYIKLDEKERDSVKNFILQMANKINESEKKAEKLLISEKYY